MELVTGDDGVVSLAHLAHLGDDGADLVVLGDSGADSRIGGVDAEDLGDLVEHVDTHLIDIGIEGVVGDLVGDVAVGNEEAGLLVYLEDLKVLHCTVHHGAGIDADHRIEELIAALYAALDQCSGVFAGIVGHVIGRDVDGAGVRCAESYREAVTDIEQCLGDMVAGIAEADIAFGLSLLYQLIVSVLKQFFKVDKMLKIFQMLHLFFKVFLFFGVRPSLL